MLGKRTAQLGFFESDYLYLEFVGADSFYGYLSCQRDNLFRDDDFTELYCPDNGRPGVPPSQLAIALLLQTYDKVSDEEAKARADYDIRWKVALGIKVEDRPFAKSTLQLFRSQLILNEKMRDMFKRSLELAKEAGYLKQRKMKVVLDTTNILGRGAVKDTYNLLADGIRKLMRELAKPTQQSYKVWVDGNGYERYLASSIKGEAEVDWDLESARDEFLKGIVLDAERLLILAKATAKNEKEQKSIEPHIALLKQLIGQDVERHGEAMKLKKGVAKDRVISVQDPEMRHGRKSSSKLFNGHKASIAVDSESQLITAVEVLAGNVSDPTQALELTQKSESNTGLDVEETIGDCAYGDGNTRQTFVDANRKLVAKMAQHGRHNQLNKEQFQIDLEKMSCTCPAGTTTTQLIPQGKSEDKDGKIIPHRAFLFDAVICTTCPVRSDCIKAKTKDRGRTIHLHPQEGLLQEARALQKSDAFKDYRQLRQVVEHRFARLAQLGIRQARYKGRKKTLFQLTMAATVANLSLVATKTGQLRPR